MTIMLNFISAALNAAVKLQCPASVNVRAPRGINVNQAMLRRREYLQVLWSVVCANPINVMNNFVFRQLPSEDLFHDYAMFCNLPAPGSGKVDIAVRTDVFPAFPSRGILSDLVDASTFAGAVLTIAALNLLLECKKRFAAYLTCSWNCAVVMTLWFIGRHKNTPFGLAVGPDKTNRFKPSGGKARGFGLPVQWRVLAITASTCAELNRVPLRRAVIQNGARGIRTLYIALHRCPETCSASFAASWVSHHADAPKSKTAERISECLVRTDYIISRMS